MRTATICIILILLASSCAAAVEHMPFEEVNTEAFVSETQVMPPDAGDDHVALAWWMPQEFWKVSLSQDSSLSESDMRDMLDLISGVSILAVVQADISAFGAFDFYSKEEIEGRMKLAFFDDHDRKWGLTVQQKVNPDLELLLGVMKPMLGAAMGNLGNNMHFYVIDEGPTQRLDPYAWGRINVKLWRRNGDFMQGDIEMPVNALFVPRECPNGREAHVTWKYCPWTGEKLED